MILSLIFTAEIDSQLKTSFDCQNHSFCKKIVYHFDFQMLTVNSVPV